MSTKRKNYHKQKARLKKELREQLVAQLGIVFAVADSEGYTFEELAEASYLSISTINRLYYGAFVWVRYETVQMLCKALDLPLNIDASDYDFDSEEK